MPVIGSAISSVPANDVLEVLSASQFNFLSKRSAIGIRASAAVAGVLLSFFLSGSTIANQVAIPGTNRSPIAPEDNILATSGEAGEKMFLEFRNTTGAAVIVQWSVDIL